MPALKLKPGVFTDAGYRYRKNTLDKVDLWVPGWYKEKEHFYDVTFFSSDEIEVGIDYLPIAEIYFRIKVDEI